jgi:hypothetical protein
MNCTLEIEENETPYEPKNSLSEYAPYPLRSDAASCERFLSSDKWQGRKQNFTLVKWPRKADLEESFRAKAQQWKKDTEFESSTHEIALNPAYQSIIGMGKAVIPMILKDLSENGGRWFWALKFIADTDPVPERYRGVVPKMKEAWLEWGRKNHYL